jgi:excinuclease UvrABC nuclease subunit
MAVKSRLGNWLNPVIDSSSIAGLGDIAPELAVGFSDRAQATRETQMRKAAKNLEFEKAVLLRDRIVELCKDEELLSPLTSFR